MARSKLNVAEKYYIAQNPENYSTKELAKMFSCTEKTIRTLQKPVKQVTQEVEQVAQEVQEEPKTVKPTQGINVGDSMGKVSRNGHIIGAVMTPTASMLADEARRSNRKPLSEIMKDCIHKPRG